MADPQLSRRRRNPLPGNASAAGSAPGSPQSTSAIVAFALLLLGAAAAIFFAGGADQGNLGAFLLCAGTALIVCPPRAPVRLGVAGAAAAVLLCCATALLPARLFHVSVWRQALAAAPGLPLPATVSPAPAQTVFWLAVLGLTLLIGIFALTQPVRSRPLFGLALAGVGICGLYAGLSILARVSGWTYPFSGGATFGFLPNRNHTATLLVTGSVLAAGVALVAWRERWWLALELTAASLALSLVGLCFFSESRAGVVFLVVGIGGWMAGLGRKHWDRPLLIALGIAVLAVTTLFFTVKSNALDRLLKIRARGGRKPGRRTGRAARRRNHPGRSIGHLP